MKISYENFHVGTPTGPTLAELLIGVEADLVISDNERNILSEPQFPIGELAYHLGVWCNSTKNAKFVLDTMSTDPGWVTIQKTGAGWAVGSILEPDKWSAPEELVKLKENIQAFVENVRADLRSLGVHPDPLPSLAVETVWPTPPPPR